MERKLLILDIDETLLFASKKPLNIPHDFKTDEYFIYCRPHLSEFLDFADANFKLALWTTGTQLYADTIVKLLFQNYSLEFVWTRDKCTQTYNVESHKHQWIKKLKKVKKKGYPLESVLMIDNTPKKLQKNYGNLISVSDFLGNLEDKELLQLIKYLSDIKVIDNVRNVEKRHWRIKYPI